MTDGHPGPGCAGGRRGAGPDGLGVRQAAPSCAVGRHHVRPCGKVLGVRTGVFTGLLQLWDTCCWCFCPANRSDNALRMRRLATTVCGGRCGLAVASGRRADHFCRTNGSWWPACSCISTSRWPRSPASRREQFRNQRAEWHRNRGSPRSPAHHSRSGLAGSRSCHHTERRVNSVIRPMGSGGRGHRAVRADRMGCGRTRVERARPRLRRVPDSAAERRLYSPTFRRPLAGVRARWRWDPPPCSRSRSRRCASRPG